MWLPAFLAVSLLGCDAQSSRDGRIRATLLDVTFPDPQDVNGEPLDASPQQAPLVQQIDLEFSVGPDAARLNATVLPIVDAAGAPVAGEWHVEGRHAIFTPALPLRPVGALLEDGSLDAGGGALSFGGDYALRTSPELFGFIASIAAPLLARFPDPADPRGIVVPFATLDVADDRALRGLAATPPQRIAADPVDGTTGISPNFFTDPDDRFPPRPAFTLTFDAPLRPESAMRFAELVQLLDLDDRPAARPDGVDLAVEVRLVENRRDRAVLEVLPGGVLPFGHLLALQHDGELKGIGELGAAAGAAELATTFTVADDPGGALRDLLVEGFEETKRRDGDAAQLARGELGAEWDRDDSDLLEAGFEFEGTGTLGRFLPVGPPPGTFTTVLLDTDSQLFPLFDGSTPDAPAGLTVNGGVFDFTDIDLPARVTLRVTGSQPLVLRATGSVRIAGTIDLHGEIGTSEFAYDSAFLSIPGGAGGPGGGRGGDAHPLVFFPADQLNYLSLVSPTFSEAGLGIDPADGVLKRIGGGGAQAGILDQKDSKGNYQTNDELGNCDEFRMGNGNCKIAGGGGGSLFRAGATPLDKSGNVLNGIANVHPDAAGGWLLSDDTTSLAGTGGLHPFADDGSTSNDFFGAHGQLTRLIGGQGGGGGGTLTDSYYCGNWCDLDSDPANDGCCANEDRMDRFGYGASVGDSRGGAGGGGGGAFRLAALGAITLEATAFIDARGGTGGGGEGIGCSYWGGGGGGGAGGTIALQSASSLFVAQGAILDVRGGRGDDASPNNDYLDCSNSGNGAMGDGGDGGHGLIQLQVASGSTATVVFPGTSDTNGSLRPPSSWIDPTNTLVPVESGPISRALSTWYDFGRISARSSGAPLLGFTGVDGAGFVLTDGSGNVVAPDLADFRCLYRGRINPATGDYEAGEEPQLDFVPVNATVQIEFQGADAIVPGSKEIDPATLTAWSGDVAIASGRQFLRWRVTFDLAADGSDLTLRSRRPALEQLQLHADYGSN
ncbi:MAG: hypothetical protein JNL90_14910 [Planctomycetes bacterium]|nr:hypothetical protein [Planctomycetota bacterium]